jgi:hypothetical protein
VQQRQVLPVLGVEPQDLRVRRLLPLRAQRLPAHRPRVAGRLEGAAQVVPWVGRGEEINSLQADVSHFWARI